ncbi:MAG: exo-alpha-sialidase [Pirellulales bacterium]|nr:exo-alpha-sialidase [Pirellulales bacterium]
MSTHPIFCSALAMAVAVTCRAVAAEDSPPRGYSIPTIDLAAETHRQVIVDREPGQYLGHPTTVLLEDNRTIIAVYPKGHGRGAIVMKRSRDAGLTWSRRLPTPKSWATSLEVPTLYRTIDPRGAKRLIMFSGLYPIRMAHSEDDGHTWSELEPIGDWVAWIGTYDDLVRGREGQYRVRLMDNTKGRDCAYPGLVVLPDGTFVATTYGHWTEGESPYIASVRFKLEEIDALARRQ